MRDARTKQTTQLKVYYYGRQPSKFRSTPFRAWLLSLQQMRRGLVSTRLQRNKRRDKCARSSLVNISSSSKTCSIEECRRRRRRRRSTLFLLARETRSSRDRVAHLISPVNDALVRQVESTSLGRDGLTG